MEINIPTIIEEDLRVRPGGVPGAALPPAPAELFGSGTRAPRDLAGDLPKRLGQFLADGRGVDPPAAVDGAGELPDVGEGSRERPPLLVEVLDHAPEEQCVEQPLQGRARVGADLGADRLDRRERNAMNSSRKIGSPSGFAGWPVLRHNGQR